MTNEAHVGAAGATGPYSLHSDPLRAHRLATSALPAALPSVLLGVVLSISGCSSGDESPLPIDSTGEFVVQGVHPQNGGQVFLNDVIAFDFSHAVDLQTVSFNSVAFQALDPLGDPTGETVSGTFRLAVRPGDTAIGRRLEFEPRLPRTGTYDDGGFKPGREYLVQLVGGARHNGTGVQSTVGRPLAALASFRFAAVEGSSAAQLFRNPLPGGPRGIAPRLTITGATSLREVPLNLFGARPVELRLTFDQALNPSSTNLPVAFDPDPATRRLSERGRVWLEYDDPEFGDATWIPAQVDLERNDSTGATLVLRPIGVLPNNATVRVIVEATVEDIAGESNVGEPAFGRVFGSFDTVAAYDQQWNGIVETFDSTDLIDLAAAFPEPMAEVGQGFVRAAFDFGGLQTTQDYRPTAIEVVLDTSFTQVVPVTGPPINVSGGVFRFHDVTIPQGVTVQGRGPNPMVWLCTGDMRVDGTLSVRGGDGERVSSLNSATFAKAGGIGVCGGGNGGDGSPNSGARSPTGSAGRGPMQVPGRGGQGGLLSCLAGCMQNDGGGSGGGGGSLATQGDPFYAAPLPGTGYRQLDGDGGMGCSNSNSNPVPARSATLFGGDAGAVVFVDSRSDNDFFGAAVDLNRNVRITGELAVPVGGGGGGGGGDHSQNLACANDPSWIADSSGGGGGGGGGALIVRALGEIEVSTTGRIVADGGHGGGGAWAGSCNRGGGGGAGAGGMVILMSNERIVLHTHGGNNRWNYAERDYDFCVSADGGVCTTGGYAGTGSAWLIESKYPAQGLPTYTGEQYDLNPLGGFGGLGIVQLMAPVGSTNQDGTNTVLDDNIVLMRSGLPLAGAAKQAALAWRGFPDGAGAFFDDDGDPVAIGDQLGDIRPAPQLLPVPFGPRSRVRSRWLDTGASKRRPLAQADGLPRGLVTAGGNVVGPVFEFAGTQNDGFVQPTISGNSAIIVPAEAVAATPIARLEAGVSHGGQPAYRIELAAPALGQVTDRYRQHEAQLLDAADQVRASLPVLGHGSDVLFVATDDVLPAGVERVRIVRKFFRIETGGSEGLGPLADSGTEPIANVRIGFAFHQDPGSATASRYPADDDEFVYSLTDPQFLEWVQLEGAPGFVQWDVTFDIAHAPGTSAGPRSPRPRLDWLRLPFRF